MRRVQRQGMRLEQHAAGGWPGHGLGGGLPVGSSGQVPPGRLARRIWWLVRVIKGHGSRYAKEWG